MIHDSAVYSPSRKILVSTTRPYPSGVGKRIARIQRLVSRSAATFHLIRRLQMPIERFLAEKPHATPSLTTLGTARASCRARSHSYRWVRLLGLSVQLRKFYQRSLGADPSSPSPSIANTSAEPSITLRQCVGYAQHHPAQTQSQRHFGRDAAKPTPLPRRGSSGNDPSCQLKSSDPRIGAH